MIKTSAPGKLMLLGEHSVVYGQPCIVTAISERLEVSISNIEDIAMDRRFVDAAIQEWGDGKDYSFSIKSAFSGKYGFGSSAAVTVATLKAMRPNAENRALFEAAYKIVLDVQGVGSGFDVAAATYGGTIYFVTGGKVIEPLAIKELPLIVGYTGMKADTTTLIKQVAEKKEKNPEKVERIFQAISKLVDDAKQRMLEGDWERVGKLMDFNQEYLRDLGVSSEKLEAMISAAKKAGAWGAKLSGAGGGDCMIALHPDGVQGKPAIVKAIQEAGGQVIDVVANAQGVRVETTDNQAEQFIVVDAQDKVLGYRSRFDCHSDKTLIHRSLDVIVFNEKGEVLLQKRSMTKDTRPGYWGVSVGGHVAKGETYEEAALREMKEEIGVVLPVTMAQKFLFEYPHETEMDVVFIANSNGPFIPNTDEIDEVKFFSKNELSRKLLDPTFNLTELSYECLKRIHFI